MVRAGFMKTQNDDKGPPSVQSSISVSVAFGEEAANTIQHELVVIRLSYRRLFLA